ncbi:MAG TPA: tetratricopeptide repeat-containing protein [Polyangiaceae bacterium]|nr:tetratricopeptide repeat-containing protein [Polyangiaceae bacterium]
MALCFVVMGFGKKTDYSDPPRTLDLDRTYEAIIKPAVTDSGLECVRADEVSHSGLIDKPMYEMLLRADLVIADISTGNPNALYELGVRHALKPFSTIVMKEVDGKFSFDLNHIATLQYKHLGEDIGSREAALKIIELKKLITNVMAKPQPDSPVYTFLQGLTGPTMTSGQLSAAVAVVKAQSDSLSSELEAARSCALKSDFSSARDHFQRAYTLQLEMRRSHEAPGAGAGAVADPYIVQQLALHTYKAQQPSAVEALRAGLKIIEQLNPTVSTDPETLGIAGAIQKRLYAETNDLTALNAAIQLYGRGFEIQRDYYNGENYALCLDLRSARHSSNDEALYDRMTARKVREEIVKGLEVQLSQPRIDERSDYRWMLATMANTLLALGRDGSSFEARFRTLAVVDWELKTFEKGKTHAFEIAGQAP